MKEQHLFRPTVQDLIDVLMAIEDKAMPINIDLCDSFDIYELNETITIKP